jgi:arylsulfatase A-like enzyme
MKILVIVARGLQASLVGAYGNHWVTTPALDALAARGVLFDRCYADAASPEGVRRAWRTGRLYLPAPGGDPPSDAPDLLAALRAADVPTMLVHDVSRPLPDAFLQGWSATVEVDPAADEDPLELALQGAGELLEALRDEKNALVWLDLPTALPPWNVPDEIIAPYFDYELTEDEPEEAVEDAEEDEDEEDVEFVDVDDIAEDEEVAAEMLGDEEAPPDFMTAPPANVLGAEEDHLYLSLRTSYAAAISYLDAGIGQLLETLDELDPERQTVVIFTSDIGLPLGEHGPIGWPHAGPHEELLHVPLIFRLPGAAQAGRREASACQPIDLAVTLADLFGVSLPGAVGQNLVPTNASTPPRPYILSAVAPDGRVVWALRTPEWSYVWPAPRDGEEAVPGKLFRQPEDPWEVNDVRQHHLELAEHFEQVLRAAVTACRQPGPITWPPLLAEDDLLQEVEAREREGEAPAEPVESERAGE